MVGGLEEDRLLCCFVGDSSVVQGHGVQVLQVVLLLDDLDLVGVTLFVQPDVELDLDCLPDEAESGVCDCLQVGQDVPRFAAKHRRTVKDDLLLLHISAGVRGLEEADGWTVCLYLYLGSRDISICIDMYRYVPGCPDIYRYISICPGTSWDIFINIFQFFLNH